MIQARNADGRSSGRGSSDREKVTDLGHIKEVELKGFGDWMHGEVEKEPEIIPSVSVKTGCLQVTETQNNWLTQNTIYFSHVKIWKPAVQGWRDIFTPKVLGDSGPSSM